MRISPLLAVAGLMYYNAQAEFKPETYQGSDGQILNYQISIPENISAKGKCPLVIFFHGAGERGNDNQAQLKNGVKNILKYTQIKNIPAIIIAPQCPAGQQWVDVPWSADRHTMPENPSEPMKLAMELLDKTIQDFPVDRSRIYVSGLSMGGFGTWDLLQRKPDLFAAAMPVCGGGDPAYAKKIKNVPIWALHGDSDGTVKTIRSRDMIHALEAAGGHPRYTEFLNTGHNAWIPAYANPDIVGWIFDQRKTQ